MRVDGSLHSSIGRRVLLRGLSGRIRGGVIGGGEGVLKRDFKLRVDVRDQDAWDMIWFFEQVERRKKRKKK